MCCLKYFTPSKKSDSVLVSLLELMQQTISAYLIDVDEGLNIVNTFICPTNEIPYEYLPSHNSLFNESQYEQYALTLKASLLNE